MKYLVYPVCLAVFIAFSCSGMCAPAKTGSKHMQVGAPFTLILELNPTGTPVKVDSLLAAGNKILLGYGKGEFAWYIAKTPNKWVKMAAGAAVIGFPARLALSYDGKTMKSYYNNTLAASLAVSPKQFTGVVPIKVNDWTGEYVSALAYAKTLSHEQIELASLPKKSDQNSEPTPSASTQNQFDPTMPMDSDDEDSQKDTNSTTVVPVAPVVPDDTAAPTMSAGTSPVDRKPDQPDEETNTTDDTKRPHPSEPGNVEPVEPVQPDEPVTPAEPSTPMKPTASEPSALSAPADLETSTVPRITVTVKVLAVTPTPEPDKILPYKHAIVTQEVEVLSVDKGRLLNIKKGDKLRIARWGILQGQKTDVSKTRVGDKYSIPLESYKDHQELERQYTVDTLPENYDLPYLLDVTE